MAESKVVISFNFPYLPVKIAIKQRNLNLEALLDTGFDGNVILPPKLITNGKLSAWMLNCKLADDSVVKVPAYLGSVKLGDKKLNNITVLIMGDEPIIGRGVIDHFRVVLDHGNKITAE